MVQKSKHKLFSSFYFSDEIFYRSLSKSIVVDSCFMKVIGILLGLMDLMSLFDGINFRLFGKMSEGKLKHAG